MVTVALDIEPQHTYQWIDAAAPTHPSLIDTTHVTDQLFGFVNIPMAVWIDEGGTIVRPAEVAFAQPAERAPSDEADSSQAAVIAQLPEQARVVIEAMTKAVDRTGRYTEAVRDWVANGADSRFVLSPEEVVARSRPRPMEFGLAAAHFELGQHLHRNGFPLDAVPHFREAHRLDPENWSYPRDAMSLVDPSWGKVYDRDLLAEVAEVGPATFYPPLDM